MINRQNSDMNDINIEEPVTAASSIYDLACYKTMIYDWLLPTCLVWSGLVWSGLFSSIYLHSYVRMLVKKDLHMCTVLLNRSVYLWQLKKNIR